ncbi:MAG: bifunctional phosphoribosyl-AMP cyclohydrolase/phosphoribosyl-ATP diphosphatase HisIE [Clostridia bacterium]|nr:bifunctional phosphoribosyl-AMP cyclohydrolase/phosphoribosyl-ATP diphosphatase HisIE [Clostridia bacterium]
MFDIKNLKYNADGLIPAIITDAADGDVLMLGYMNAESLGITLEQKKVCFFSRSRQKLWLKGETSGNFLNVVSIKTDCDADTLLITAKPDGPTCHTGARSCFFEDIYEDEDAEQAFCLDDLMKLIEGRKTDPKEGSYTTYLFEKGIDKILKKVGEECTEVIIAGKGGDRAEAIFEIADLTYHIMVMMTEMGISLDEVRAELASRHVVDKKIKQEKMK